MKANYLKIKSKNKVYNLNFNFIKYILLLLLGFVIGNFKADIYAYSNNLKANYLNNSSHFLSIENQEKRFITSIFSDPVIKGDLYYSPIKDFKGIQDANKRILMSRSGFEHAYDSIKIIGIDQIVRLSKYPPIIRVRFIFQSNEYEAFAYGQIKDSVNRNIIASLIIPGSGVNQSTEIITSNSKNYHFGIMSALRESGGDIFTLIKPNEDFLAWHDGNNRKIIGTGIYNWQLNHGGSYALSYIVQSIAISKYLKNNYRKLIIAGLSQGGAAALSNSLQSNPTFSIIASGCSVLYDTIDYSGFNQLVGFEDFAHNSNSKDLERRLSKSSTRYLFSWSDRGQDIYSIDAKKGITEKLIKPLSNVTTTIHPFGHVFPLKEIKKFIREQ